MNFKELADRVWARYSETRGGEDHFLFLAEIIADIAGKVPFAFHNIAHALRGRPETSTPQMDLFLLEASVPY